MRRIAPLALFAIAVLAGCGSGDDSSTPSTTAEVEALDPEDITVVAGLGDSITAGSPLWDPDPAIRAQIGPALDERSSFGYWLRQEDPGLRFINCGVFGERTDEIAQRLDDCAADAEALVIQGGINDIAQGRPVSAAADDLQSMVQRGKDLGIPVALIDVLPWNNGHPAADEPIAELNREVERIGEEEGVPVLPFHETLENPDEPGTMSPEYTDDGDHPSIAGYRKLAEQAFGEFEPLAP